MRIQFKKALFSGLALFFFQGSLFSQVYSSKPSSIFGFTAGVTNTSLFNDSTNLKPGFMLHAGLAYTVMLNDRLSAGIEVQYTGKALRNESPIIKYRFFYLDLPLYLQINLSESIRINAGAQYSIATNSQMTGIDPSNPNGVNTFKINSIKPTDFGFLGGVEFDISKSISIGARYAVSSSSFFGKNEAGFGVFQLSLKYSPLKTYQVFFHKKEAQQ